MLIVASGMNPEVPSERQSRLLIVLYCLFFPPSFFFFFLIFLTVPGLSSGMWDLVPRPGIELRPPALGVWSLSHRTTNRELPDCIVCQAFLISFGVWCAQLLSSF